MIRLVLTGVIFVGGLFYLLAGVGFLLNPGPAGADFGLIADGPHGLSTIRGDMTAFFVVSAVSMVVGAWRRNGDLLLVPAALLGLTLAGRIVSLFADGTYEGFILPMAIEAVSVIVLLIASRVLPHPAT